MNEKREIEIESLRLVRMLRDILVNGLSIFSHTSTNNQGTFQFHTKRSNNDESSDNCYGQPWSDGPLKVYIYICIYKCEWKREKKKIQTGQLIKHNNNDDDKSLCTPLVWSQSESSICPITQPSTHCMCVFVCVCAGAPETH